MNAHTTFDSEALKHSGRTIMEASDALHGLAGMLAGIDYGKITSPVNDRLEEIIRDGQQMIDDIYNETNEVAVELFKVAQAYADLETSLINVFQPGQ